MSQPPTKKYPAEFKERAVKLAVESDQPIAQTAHDLGVNENTLHTWIGKYHRAERQEQQVQDEHLYEELKRLRKENARLQEEREILKPTFKGGWSTAVNFVLLPPPDTKLGQYPPHDKRCDDSLGRRGLGGWAYCLRRSARASLA